MVHVTTSCQLRPSLYLLWVLLCWHTACRVRRLSRYHWFASVAAVCKAANAISPRWPSTRNAQHQEYQSVAPRPAWWHVQSAMTVSHLPSSEPSVPLSIAVFSSLLQMARRQVRSTSCSLSSTNRTLAS